MIDVKTANVAFLDGRYEEAAQMYLDGARDADAECAFNYAYCLYRGVGVEENKALAKSFFSFAKEKIGEASYNLAVMSLYGIGTPRNYKKVYEYMHDAAVRGVIEAQLYLAVAHTLGDLFEPDVSFISLIPYHKPEYAAEVFMLPGSLEEMAREEEARMSAVRLDPKGAFEWFRIAAHHKPDYVEELSRKSKYLYARCFLDGLGTDFNRDRANNLMLVAALDGSQEALAYLETDAPYVLSHLENTELIGKIRKLEGLPAPD